MSSLLVDHQGLPALRLQTADGASAIVMLHGGHLVSWTTSGGQERLYLSDRARFDGQQAIRGGVPVIFPQFDRVGPDPGVPRHGFARTRPWSLAGTAQPPTGSSAMLRLASDATSRLAWPHDFELDLTVTLGSHGITLDLQVANSGTTPFAFTAALHTYLRVRDIAAARIRGLQGCRFRDSVAGVEDRQNQEDLSISAECDRIYYDVGAPLSLTEGSQTLEIGMQGFRDAVVWNPWQDKCAALADMPPLGFREMVCIEAAAIGTPVAMAPGQRWRAALFLRAR